MTCFLKKINPLTLLVKTKVYERTILSDVLTKTSAADIGITTIITAKNTLLKKALNDGVISLR